MTDKDISRLYQQVVIAHNRDPHNYGPLAEATHQARGYNPVCGDAVTVYFSLRDGTVTAASFEGDCCAVCTCSASLLTDRLTGMDAPAFEALMTEFERLVKPRRTTVIDEQLLGELNVFEGIREFPSRVPCATLPWHTARAAWASLPQVSTE
ncbi:MAG: SUF system NifU family Fe-S cluster assembly protein [Candidatus Omnitrophica bacterium]|nr:SUF system NifU family Fe-S cluster assembly protein [Candidatus Omnitrophota bacterium]MCB9721853.1 SUF system NifU family Fe-S cluster assembly protein [Candidatus Omnitrophota bacterium]